MNLKKIINLRTPHWFDFADLDPDTVEIRIDGVIGGSFLEDGNTAKDFIDRLNTISAPNLILHLNSPGGMVFEGFAIYNALRSSGKHVRVVIDGIAASIAAVIAMAGDEIVMPENSYLMVHYPWSIVMGNADNMLAEADTLEKLGQSIEKIFADRSGQPSETIQKLMRGDAGADGTFISAPEALELHLATEVEENKSRAAACVGLDAFNLIPPALQNKEDKTAGDPPAEENPESYKTVFSEFLKNN